jgi:acetyl-CoA carboxylase carboxyltransferase component
MFITGPNVIKTVTGEDVTMEQLGGAMSHASKSGVAHFAVDDEESLPRGHQVPAELPAGQQPRAATGGGVR